MENQEQEDGTYVHLTGRGLINVDEAGNFTVTLLGPDRQPVPGSLPITFSKDSLEFFDMHLVAEFGPEELEVYHKTLYNSSNAFTEMGKPSKIFKFCMTSTNPPPRCFHVVKPPLDPTKEAPERDLFI